MEFLDYSHPDQIKRITNAIIFMTGEDIPQGIRNESCTYIQWSMEFLPHTFIPTTNGRSKKVWEAFKKGYKTYDLYYGLCHGASEYLKAHNFDLMLI